MNLKEKYDVVIIGAGLGGITAGIYLLKSGLSVLIVDKHCQPGGYATNFKRDGFTFDVSLHLLDGCEDNGYFGSILKELDLSKKFEFYRLSPVFKQIYPGFSFSVNSNFENFKADIIRMFPSEKQNFIELIALIELIYREARNYYDKPLKFSDFSMMIKYFKTLTKYSRLSLYDMMTDFIRDKKLIEILSQLWFFFGLPSKELSCIYFSFPWTTFMQQGTYYVKGGAGNLSKGFAERFKELGGNLYLNHRVTKIRLERNKGCEPGAAGIVIDNDKYVKAKKIISNIDPKITFIELIGEENLPSTLIKKLLRLKESISAFQVYLGLKESLRKKGISDHEIFINETYDNNRAFNTILKGDYNSSPFAIGIYENKDPNFTAEGKSVVNIFIPAIYEDWKFTEKKQYIEKKNRVADLLIKRAGRYIPNISEIIETREIGTPMTMERYTGNSRGAIHGFAQIVKQSGAGRLNIATPVNNLFLTGAWTRPGGGFSTVIISGRLCATIVKSQL